MAVLCWRRVNIVVGAGCGGLFYDNVVIGGDAMFSLLLFVWLLMVLLSLVVLVVMCCCCYCYCWWW